MAEQSPLAKEALKWIEEAKTDRRRHEPWHRDVYRFAMPWRRRPSTWTQIHDQDELFDSTAIDALNDFAADLQNAYTPIEADWLNVEPAQDMSDVQAAQIRDVLKQYQKIVFAEIRRSNFHEATLEAYVDFGAGTAGMCIQDLNINEPIHCQAVPIPDLLLVRGAYGGVDFRGRSSRVRAGNLKAVYPKAKIPVSMTTREAGDPVEVTECLWRLWDQPGVERWQYVLLLDDQEAESAQYESAGSCALITPRWKIDSTTAWGIGPLYTALPEIKSLDQLKYLNLKHLNKVVDPIVFYEEDGTINLANGLIPGSAIPRAKGSKHEVLESGENFDVALWSVVDMQANIRRALFQDKPDQKGKTPPTASQWLDEKAQIDRRMGAPVGRLVTEWQWPIFSRFAYLLERRGILPKLELNGQAVRLRPQSPLIKSQRQQDVIVGDRALEIIGTRFGPNAVSIVVDMRETAKNIVELLGADVVKLRSAEEVKQMMAQMAQAAAAGQGQPQQ